MAYDSAATRARLLDAAYDEFVSLGLAGARVDRIAAAASANKQGIYAYFGSKEGLFDAVMAARLRVLADVAPLTPQDLPGYAGALFDALVADPGLQRLSQWRKLEFPHAAQAEIDSHVAKATEIARHYDIDLTLATDLMMIALAAAQAWNTTAPAIRNPLGTDNDHRRAGYRRSVVAAVDAMVDAVTTLDAPPSPGIRTTTRAK